MNGNVGDENDENHAFSTWENPDAAPNHDFEFLPDMIPGPHFPGNFEPSDELDFFSFFSVMV